MYARAKALALLVSVLTLVALAASPHAQTPAGQVTITGRVIAEATGQPVRRAYVIVHGPDTKTTRVTMSDVAGTFRFEGLPRDRYRVGASKRPLLSASVDATSQDVIVTLPTGAVVTGTVVNSLGRPESGLEMNISGPGLISPQPTITDHQGEYRFFSLPPGEYTIAAPRRKGEPRVVAVGPVEHKQVAALQVEDATTAPMPGPVSTSGTNVIAGVAVNERTGAPLPHAPVTSRTTGLRAVSDVDGRFRFEGVGDNTYVLRVEGAGFAPTSAAEVTVKDNARIIDVTLRGSQNGRIAGVVRDEVGDPIVGMPVTVSLRQILNAQVMMMPRGSARTDDRGMFDLRNLPAGEYLLCACAGEPLPIDPGLLRQLGPTTPDAATVSRLIDETVQTYAPTYYPGLTRSSDSPLVVVDHGDARTGMDITMYGARPFVVSGQLVGDAGVPTDPMQAFLAQDGDRPEVIGVSAREPLKIGADGRFRFTGVPPGTYTLAAIPATPMTRTPWGHTQVTVVDRDVEQLVVPVGAGLSLTGRVEFSGNTPAPTPQVLEKTSISMGPLDLSMVMFLSVGNAGTMGSVATLDATGRFKIENLSPGRHRVQLSLRGSPWRIQRIIAPNAGPHADVVTVEDGGTADILVVMTDLPQATLTGTIILDRQRYESAGTTRVTMFPVDEAKWLEPAEYPGQFAWQFIRPDGTFTVENVPPGEYFVLRGSSFDGNMSPRSFERWSKTAERVTLRAGQTTTVTVKR
jgi:Carboxypeptidase regulatory-like domain